MNDLVQTIVLDNDNRIAAGSVKVLDYEALVGESFTFDSTQLDEGGGNDFTAEIDNATTATNLAAAIDGISGYSASVDGGDDTLINIVADDPGLAGNVEMSCSEPEAVQITEMTGGADYFYSDVLAYDNIDNSSVNIEIEVLEISGEGAEVIATFQSSQRKDDWDDVLTLPPVDEQGEEKTAVATNILSFGRVRLELSSGTATVQISLLASYFGGEGDDTNKAKVQNRFRDSSALPQTDELILFEITDSVCVKPELKVTTAIEDQACNAKIVFSPASGPDVDLCAAVNIADLAVGTILHFTGELTDDMQISEVEAFKSQEAWFRLGVGTIKLVTDASNTGEFLAKAQFYSFGENSITDVVPV